MAKDKVFRSIEEVRQHYFPDAYRKEQEMKRMEDPKSFGTGLVKDLMDALRKELKNVRIKCGCTQK